MNAIRTRIVALAVIGVPAILMITAYTIAPGDDIHERMTMAAVRCVDVALNNNQKPAHCDTNIDKSLPKPDMSWITPANSNIPDLESAVKWPDDPTHQIGLTTGIQMYVAINKCVSKAEKKGYKAAESFQGLACSSNVGTMQFFHAMATTRGEPAADTYYKIMHWADFLYDVSTAWTDAQLDQSYCDVFSANGDAFDKAMVPTANSVRCGDRKHPGWAVRTLFTTKCKSVLFMFKVCNAEKDADRYNSARMYATGSLLHMIQDSYSQSHCVRGQCEIDSTKKVVAKVECTPIRMYTTYAGQSNHADADRNPVFAPSCSSASPQTDDPILAGAKVLWDIRNRAPRDVFDRDMERVFGTAEHAASLPAADLGECFTTKLD